MKALDQGHQKSGEFVAWLDRSTATVAKAAELWGHASKVGYPLSVAVGLWLIRAFTWRAAIPFPQPDASLLVFLALVGVVCYIVLVWLASIPLMAIASASTDPELQRLVPSGASWPLTFSEITTYCGRYLQIYLPFFFGSSSFKLIVVFGTYFYPNLGVNPIVIGNLSFYAVASVVSVAFFGFGLLLSTAKYYLSADRFIISRPPNSTGVLTYFGVVISSSGIAYLWAFSALITAVALAVQTQLVPTDSSILVLLVILTIILAWHFFAITIQLWKFHRSPAVALLFVVPLIVYGPKLGGFCLRVLGLGGGTPISLVANVVEAGSTTKMPIRIDGCLVLLSGTQLTIQRALEGGTKISSCHLNPRTPNIVNGVVIPTIVDTISRSDVADIFRMGQVP